jgi:hypothetical protein
MLNNQMVLFFVAKYHEFSPFWAVIPQPELKNGLPAGLLQIHEG